MPRDTNSTQHDPDRLRREANGGREPETLPEAADALAKIIKGARDGTLPSGGTY